MDRSPSVRILDEAGHSVFIVTSRLGDHNIGYLYELHGLKLANSTNWQIKKLHPVIFTRCSNKTGDYFFTFWQKFIRIVATCWRVALPCGSR